MMRLEWLEDILAVLEAGSITAAAEKRHVTQSAFTRRLRAIEQSLGTELFDRTRKPIKLRAHVLLQEMELRRAVATLQGLRSTLRDDREAGGNQISFACQHTIASTISARYIKELTKDGNVQVQVRSSNRESCLMMLLTSEVDLAIVYETPREIVLKEKVVFIEESLGSDWMIPVIATRFMSDMQKAIRGKMLPLVSYPREVFLGQLFESAFLAQLNHEFQHYATAETSLAFAALHYTLEGVGIGWLPQSIAAPHIEQGALVDMSDTLPRQELIIKMMRLPADLPKDAGLGSNRSYLNNKETRGLTDRVWSKILESPPPVHQ